jgi:hypothetical protein
MRSWHKSLIAAAALCTLTGSYVMAAGQPADRNPSKPGLGWGAGGSGGGGGNKGVPGPIAGAGLPFLLLAGGYVLVRRYRARNTAE